MNKNQFEVLANIRICDVHLFITRSGVSLCRNRLHSFDKEWWPPKFTKGEFRAKDGWKWFQVYRFFNTRAL